MKVRCDAKRSENQWTCQRNVKSDSKIGQVVIRHFHLGETFDLRIFPVQSVGETRQPQNDVFDDLSGGENDEQAGERSNGTEAETRRQSDVGRSVQQRFQKIILIQNG